MQIKRYRLREGKLPLMMIFAVGVFIGMLIINFGKSILLENTGLLDEYTLYHMKYMTVDSSALFYYVLKQRMGSMLILAVLSTTYLGLLVCGGVVLWYGIGAGIFLATAVMRYGIKGILLVLSGVFPQFLIYIPAMILMLYWCQSLYRYIYLDRKMPNDSVNSLLLPKRLLQLVGILLFILVGAIMESFVNPGILQRLLTNF